MNVCRGLWPSLLAVFLSACIHTAEAPEVAARPDAAVITSFRESTDVLTWRTFIPVYVNDRGVSRSAENWNQAHIEVPQGTVKIVVQARTSLGAQSGGVLEATILLHGTVQAGKVYRLDGRVDRGRIVTWLVDRDTGERASEDASGPWTRAGSR
jgi:hypothetical protein